jgi:ferredoxin, 2Fe-2S
VADITYIEPSGQPVTVSIPDGWSLMQGATSNGVDGIIGECGGAASCATCHCYVDDARLAELPPPSGDELAMLETAAAPLQRNSRLACQLKAGPELSGLVVTLPPVQE